MDSFRNTGAVLAHTPEGSGTVFSWSVHGPSGAREAQNVLSLVPNGVRHVLLDQYHTTIALPFSAEKHVLLSSCGHPSSFELSSKSLYSQSYHHQSSVHLLFLPWPCTPHCLFIGNSATFRSTVFSEQFQLVSLPSRFVSLCRVARQSLIVSRSTHKRHFGNGDSSCKPNLPEPKALCRKFQSGCLVDQDAHLDTHSAANPTCFQSLLSSVSAANAS